MKRLMASFVHTYILGDALMDFQITDPGGPGAELAPRAMQYFQESATKEGTSLVDFDPGAGLAQQIAWAERQGLQIGCTYLRYSTKQQNSTEDQLRENVSAASRIGVFIPAALVSVDEGKKGRSNRRQGLARLKEIMVTGRPLVLVLFKLSRLYRNSYKAHEFIAERVVEAGHRAVIFSDGVDTQDKKAWKSLLHLRGIMDDLFLDNLVDHVKAGLVGIFENGWTVGPLGVGFRPKVLPDAPLTNLGRPRTMPEIAPEVAALIVQHFEWIRDGMTLAEGLRRWRAAGGPADPRSPTGHMTPTAYRRLLSNWRLTGRWTYGRTKTTWSSAKDYSLQVEQPDAEVAKFQSEELRIVSDELFLAVQRRLAALKLGPRGPKKQRPKNLWDFTTEFFFCAACSTEDNLVRLYQSGAHGRGMTCRHGNFCLCKSAVRRKEAVQAVCTALCALIAFDQELIDQIVSAAQQVDAQGENQVERRIQAQRRRISVLSKQLDDLYEMLGQGSDADRKEVKAKIRTVQADRTQAQHELSVLQRSKTGATKQITAVEVRAILANFSQLLEDGAAGRLGEDTIYKAVAVFRRLTGGQIMVHVEPRPARKQTSVRGTFRPCLLQATQEEAELAGIPDDPPAIEVSVWLRKPPLIDEIAPRVKYLIDEQGQSFRQAAKTLRAEGYKVNSGNVWNAYHRAYEMLGLKPPKRPYNNGKRRRSA